MRAQEQPNAFALATLNKKLICDVILGLAMVDHVGRGVDIHIELFSATSVLAFPKTLPLVLRAVPPNSSELHQFLPHKLPFAALLICLGVFGLWWALPGVCRRRFDSPIWLLS